MEVENLIFNIRRQGGAQGALDGLRGSLRNLEGQSKKTTSALGKLVESLKRIAFYRVVRAAIKELSQAFQDGLQNVYAYSDAIGGTLAKALDGLKSSSTQMKNALGSAFGELLQNITPVLITIINLVTRAANAIAQLFAVLDGRSTYSKAVATAEKWADATAGGAASAKEWKNQLLGFDVINKLNDNDSGGGGGGAATNPADMFEEEPAVNKWAEEFRRITMEWLDSVDFSKITAAFNNLKESIKGLVSVIDTALYWAYTEVLLPLAKWVIEDAGPATLNLFASMIDVVTAALKKLWPIWIEFWNNIVKPVAKWIGDVVVRVLNGLSDVLTNLAKKFSEADSIQDFLDSLNDVEATVATLIMILGGLAIAIFAINHPILTIIAVVAWAANVIVENWDTIKQTLKEWKDTVVEFVKTHVEDFKNLGADFSNSVEGIKTKLDEWVKKIKDLKTTFIGKVEEIKKKFEEFKNDLSEKVNNIKTKLGEFQTKVSAVKNAVVGFFSAMWSGISGPINSIINGISSIISWASSAISWLNSLSAKAEARIEVNGGLWTSNFASGGYPDTGQLFVAREAGPELVGTIGGQTAVANNDDIYNGIRQGVFEAVSAAIGTQSNRGRGETVININGREFFRATYNDMQAVTREHGISLVTA